MMRATLFGALTASILVPASPVRADDAEEKAAKFVESLRGRVERDGTKPDKPVVAVSLSGQVTDADLKELANFKHLNRLSLQLCAKLTDAGLKELAPLKKLETLDLGYTPTTDAALVSLG